LLLQPLLLCVCVCVKSTGKDNGRLAVMALS